MVRRKVSNAGQTVNKAFMEIVRSYRSVVYKYLYMDC